MKNRKRLVKWFGKEEKGFTLIELLVVVAILGILIAIAVPSVGKFIDTGKNTAKNVELRDVQLAVTAMMTESADGLVDAGTGAWTSDMSTVQSDSTNDGVVNLDLKVSNYLANGLSAKTNMEYQVTPQGLVTQQPVPAP